VTSPFSRVAFRSSGSSRVVEAIEGADAVISTVAGVRNDPHRLADLTRVITAAMADVGVRRLVVTGACGTTICQESISGQ
jgi:putative NADH-flavin reductase